jgi:hypothetical protein
VTSSVRTLTYLISPNMSSSRSEVKYGVRSPKFIWAPVYTVQLINKSPLDAMCVQCSKMKHWRYVMIKIIKILDFVMK